MRISPEEAIALLKSAENVALPTETVYGLAASLHYAKAIENIFALKGRPSSNPLIIHVASAALIHHYLADVPPDFQSLADAFWPGPLTLVLPIDPEKVPTSVRSGLPTAGFRVPDHPLTLDVLKSVGPIVMPSANLSGRPSSTNPDHVEKDFGSSFPVLDGGSCLKGLESTILYYQGERWVILRLGTISQDEFEALLGYRPAIIKKSSDEEPLCPGQLFRHYSPEAELILDPEGILDSPVIIGFLERNYPEGKKVIFLGSLQDPSGVAENLYGLLRQLDQVGISKAWIDMDFPRTGLWQTIAERLQRAAS